MHTFIASFLVIAAWEALYRNLTWEQRSSVSRFLDEESERPLTTLAFEAKLMELEG